MCFSPPALPVVDAMAMCRSRTATTTLPSALALDGQRRRLAGAKTWALLGRVVIGPPITRRELANLLWPEANDPRAACRWTILQVRRALEPAATLLDSDDGLRLVDLDGATVVVDVLMLHAGRTPIGELGSMGDVLLAGIDPRDAPEFEVGALLGDRSKGSPDTTPGRRG